MGKFLEEILPDYVSPYGMSAATSFVRPMNILPQGGQSAPKTVAPPKRTATASSVNLPSSFAPSSSRRTAPPPDEEEGIFTQKNLLIGGGILAGIFLYSKYK